MLSFWDVFGTLTYKEEINTPLTETSNVYSVNNKQWRLALLKGEDDDDEGANINTTYGTI